MKDEEQQFILTADIVENTILTDLTQKFWRVGKNIGKGSFGEIFLASDNIKKPANSDNSKYVIKLEPHANGPLFVEIHCLLNTAKSPDIPPFMTPYIASGSHIFNNIRYRFLVLHRYKCDLHSIIKNRRVDKKCVIIIASQILEILKYFHDKGYVHSDIKAENLMIGSYSYKKNDNENYINCSNEQINTSDEESNDNFYFKTPTNSIKRRNPVDFSGSNPIRACRLKTTRVNSTYQDMLKRHYLRPSKLVNYVGLDTESNTSLKDSDFDPSTVETPKETKRYNEPVNDTPISNKKNGTSNIITEDRIFLIDFGLASKFIDPSGNHRPFCMDQRRAHDGTLEFTSRDAHMGAHSRRSDLECLGYNLIYWCMGFLPWKDEKILQQPEHVHRMKEYFMTDVTFMLKQIYGKVPTFLCDFMNYVCKLTYDQRPDYDYCKSLFEREFVNMGYKKTEMILNIEELKIKVKDVKHEVENNVEKMKNIKSIMKFGLLLPFKETHNSSNKISPKNLRSKTEKLPKKQKKKISWTEILNTDPDKISRQRAELEYDRAQILQTPMRYTGNPTYAIIEMEQKIKFKDKLDIKEHDTSDDVIIKGYTKPMMDILKKRQLYLMSKFEKTKEKRTVNESSCNSNEDGIDRSRRHGLRKNIIPTRRSLSYKNLIEIKKNKRNSKQMRTVENNVHDDTSCSSNSNTNNSNNTDRSIRSSDLETSISDEIKDIINYETPIKSRRSKKNLAKNSKRKNIIQGRVEKKG